MSSEQDLSEQVIFEEINSDQEVRERVEEVFKDPECLHSFVTQDKPKPIEEAYFSEAVIIRTKSFSRTGEIDRLPNPGIPESSCRILNQQHSKLASSVKSHRPDSRQTALQYSTPERVEV